MLSQVAQIDGIFTDEKTQRLPGVQVVLVPYQNRDQADLFKAATADHAADSSFGTISIRIFSSHTMFSEKP
jgi:hypothetical protein